MRIALVVSGVVVWQSPLGTRLFCSHLLLVLLASRIQCLHLLLRESLPCRTYLADHSTRPPMELLRPSGPAVQLSSGPTLPLRQRVQHPPSLEPIPLLTAPSCSSCTGYYFLPHLGWSLHSNTSSPSSYSTHLQSRDGPLTDTSRTGLRANRLQSLKPDSFWTPYFPSSISPTFKYSI